MSNQTAGYYVAHKDDLLKEYDQTASSMESYLIARYGSEFAGELIKKVREEYETLIPSIPFIGGIRGRMMNTFLLITAQELALYKVMKQYGKPVGEAWELCHQALRLGMADFPKWKRWLLKQFMFSWLVKRVMKRRAEKQETGRFGDFEIEYLRGQENDFDYGVNYHQCGNLNFLIEHGGEELAPYVCMSDIALSDALGWGLIRTQTLADGCHHCDFRFKEGGGTRITSKTPEVQETIDRICRSEQ